MGYEKIRSYKTTIRKALVLALLALLVALLPAGPAQAEVIEVPCQTSATLALGLAIEQANDTPGEDTIRLEGGCTYGLFSNYVYDEGHNGLPEITDALTIEGNGARLERMVSSRFRLLKTGDGGALTIEDLTLANGYADDPNDDLVRGGAIYAKDDLNLRNVAILDNYAGGPGGGIFATGGDVTVSDSRFENNLSALDAGGGLFAENSALVVLYKTTFTDNVAKSYGGGAALYQSPGYFYVSWTQFEGNQLTGFDGGGAGLATLFADAYVHNSEFTSNSADGGSGGALYARDAEQLVVTESHFERNGALEGGAIYAMDTGMTLLRSTFQQNRTGTYAAALFLVMQANTTSSIGNNLWTADEAIDAQATVYVTAPVADTTALAAFEHNTFADTQAPAGIALIIERGRAEFVNNIVANYREGLRNHDGTVSAGYNLYEVSDPTRAQVGTVQPFEGGDILLDDPLFVDRAAGNYRLQEGSPAIDQGYGASLDGDIEGTERPQGDGFDIGAYEYVPQNTPPTAANDDYLTQQEKALTIAPPGVLDNDQDVDGDELTAVLRSQPANGTVTLNANGSFTYTPDNGYWGTDSFSYRAFDGEDESNTALVTIAIQKVNKAPTAVEDSYATLQDTTLVIAAPGVLDNDTDADGNELTAVLQSEPANGAVTLNANGSFSYTPDGGYNGEDSFTYRAGDGQDNSNVATVTITIEEVNVNVPPVAVGDSYATDENSTLTVPAPGVLGNDGDANGDALTALLESGPQYGQLTLEGNGSFNYTPDNGYYGEDSFTYRAQDGQEGSNVAMVTIAVQHVNVAPTAVDDTYATLQDTVLTVPAPGVLDNDQDAEGDSLTAELLSPPSHGDVRLNADGSFSYTPEGGYTGEDTFTYTAHDGQEVSDNVGTVSITVEKPETNLPPAAVGDSYETNADTALTVPAPGVLANDGDANGDALTAVLVSGPDYGQLTLDADGGFVYTPDGGYSGDDSFTYRASDGVNSSYEVTVRIEVLAEEEWSFTVFLPALLK